jgi:AcrR family transcriptional regulator
VPRQERAHATFDAALEAAARIVRQHGAAALTTNRIAERAGISIGTLYGYFPDKTAILVALARRILADDRAALITALDTDPAGEPIRSLVRALIARHRTDRSLRRAVMGVHIGAGGGDEHVAQVEEFIAQLSARAGALFGHAPPDRLRLFVATRAALGVARALVDEAPSDDPPSAALEDELVRLVYSYLGLR